MENNEIKELTEEQKEQLLALEKKVFKHTMRCAARNCLMLVASSAVVGVLNVLYIQSPAFLFAGATANALMFFRQIRLDSLEENKMIVEELAKIFK